MNQPHTDSCVSIDGYSIIRRDRVGQVGGGVAFYVSDRLGWSVPDIPVIDSVVYLCTDFQLCNKTTRVDNAYRS